MLQKLAIHNYALIDHLDIEFDQGLNIITGETGAGKSIILGALSLILGQRAESKYFFNQAKKCIIEGTFLLASETLRPIFESNDLDFSTETILRREIAIDGRSRAFINDTPVNLNVLKQIGELLIDIHSQQATQELNNEDFQLLLIDSLANHHPLLQAYQSGFNRLKNLKQQLGTLKIQADEARSRQDFNQFLYNELEEAKLSPTEQDDLELTLERLNHAEAIKISLLNATGLLTEDDHAAHTLIREAAQQLQTIAQFDPLITELYERLRSVMIELKDISDASLSIEEKTIHDAEQLILIQNRLDLLYTLQQKHRVNDNAALLLLQDQLGAQLHQLFTFDEQILNLEKEITQLNEQLLVQAEQLSQNRKKAIKLVEKDVLLTLKQVGMPNANLLFNHQLSTEITAKGLDHIQLLFSANAGQAPAPVNKVASGGELSRLMLAIKTLLAQHATLATIIFDEIDSGISGETALKVAKVLADLGKNMQVISITHLPQIAAKGDAHYFVFKTEEKSQTTTGIRRLNDEERIIAIAEMLSGRNPGKPALMNAKELLR